MCKFKLQQTKRKRTQTHTYIYRHSAVVWEMKKWQYKRRISYEKLWWGCFCERQEFSGIERFWGKKTNGNKSHTKSIKLKCACAEHLICDGTAPWLQSSDTICTVFSTLSHLSHLWFHKLFYLVFAPFFKFCHSVKVTISRIFIIHLPFKSSVYEFHLIISINIWFVCTFTFPSSAFPSSKHAQIKNIKNKT